MRRDYIPTTEDELSQDNKLYLAYVALGLVVVAIAAVMYMLSPAPAAVSAVSANAVEVSLPVFEQVQNDSALAGKHLKKVVYSIIPPWAPVMRENTATALVDESDVADLEDDDHCGCTSANQVVDSLWGESSNKH